MKKIIYAVLATISGLVLHVQLPHVAGRGPADRGHRPRGIHRHGHLHDAVHDG